MKIEPAAGPMVRRNKVAVLGLFTILFFGGGGWLLILYQGNDPIQLLLGERSIAYQVAVGVVLGLLIGSLAWWILDRRSMDGIRVRYATLIGPLIPDRMDRIFVSICAGVGEEIFFRGGIQFWLGVPITSILFVAIHGYLDPRNWRLCIYGSFMTLAIMILGWTADRAGLLAPIIAHTLIDIVLLEKLHQEWTQWKAGREQVVQS